MGEFVLIIVDQTAVYGAICWYLGWLVRGRQ